MSQDLVHKLQALEEDYLEMPPVVRRKDLAEINRIRDELGLPQVDEHLKEVAEVAGAAANEPTCHDPQEATQVSDSAKIASKMIEPVVDHTEARAIYQAYLEKVERLKPHWAYAKRVAKATSGRGQTPVKPLATMGGGGKALLCDHCGKAILLEGGEYNNVPVDVAWRRNRNDEAREKWTSWIAGGLVVEVQTNGTIRIYHGYLGQSSKHCCNIAAKQLAEARAAFDTSQRSKVWPSLLAYLKDEFPDMELEDRTKLLNKILDLMFEYDPGIGINRPDE